MRLLENIFSSYRKTAALLFVVALLLAIPITLTLLSQQQDIRQRAEFNFGDFGKLRPIISTTPAPTSSTGILPTRVLPTRTTISLFPTRIIPTRTLPSAFPTRVLPTDGGGTGGTQISLSLVLPGIGSNTQLGQNPNPKRPERIAEVSILNSTNQQILSKKGPVKFNPQTNAYEGKILLDTTFRSGAYIVKARVDNTLWRAIPGIQTINAGTTTNLPQATLVTGDTDDGQDNELNLFDYNKLLEAVGSSLE